MKKFLTILHYPTIVIVIAILFSGLLQLNGQVLEYNIIWQYENSKSTFKENGIIRNRLSFEDADYPSDPKLPVISKSVKLSSTDPREIYYFDNLKYEEIPDSLLADIELPESIPTDLDKIKLYYGRGEKYLSFSICPLRINEYSGKLERLLSYAIKDSIDYNKHLSTKLKAANALENSVLASGDWYKLKVITTGIYKLTYSDLKGMGITNPANIRVYGNGGKQLSFLNSDPRPVGLNEIPIYINKGNDASFDNGDYILFYAQGPVSWSMESLSGDFSYFRQHLHDYSDAAYYFLTCDKGEATQVPTIDNSNLISNYDVNSFTDYGYYEKNLLNLIQSGRNWYTSRIDNVIFDTTFVFPDLIIEEPAKLVALVAGRAESKRSFSLLADDEIVSVGTVSSVDLTSNEGFFARDLTLQGKKLVSGDEVKVGVRFANIEESDKAYLDCITINVRRSLKIDKNILFFRDEKSVGNSVTSRFTIQNANANTLVWDVTDINKIVNQKTTLSGSSLEFKSETGTLHEFVAFDITADYPKPELVNDDNKGKVPSQNLRGQKTVNYIIVTAKEFKEQAERLAQYHRNNSGLTVLVVTPEEIFNEFSSGMPDVSAIRDFFRYQYENSKGDDSLRYVLLFGDGSYNNHMNIEGNTNYILTYESTESLHMGSSYVTDDFYGLLDESDDNINCRGKMEIGIGRFPVRIIDGDASEAEIVVNKTINYHQSEKADWMNSFCFMGDDSSDGSYDGIPHMKQSNDLANSVGSKLIGADIKKIFLDAYQQKTSSSGPSYPDAQKELMNTLNKGVLVWNYTGHGGPGGITAEKVFQVYDVDNLKNKNKPFLFVTASCQVSRYDNVNMENVNSITPINSCGEALLLYPDAGAIALFSTTRVVFAGLNSKLNGYLYNHLFEKDTKGERKRFGEVIREAKNDTDESPEEEENKLNFALLGDPALILQYPEFKVFTDSINHKPTSYDLDTIKAYQEVTVSGHVAYNDNSEIGNFNGFVYPKVFDKEISITTLGNDDGVPIFTYLDRKNLVYKGKARVVNGKFSFSFIVPVDISYKIGLGKICYYAENDSVDAQGSFADFYIGGTSNDVIIDNNGPQIDLYMNDESFKEGGMTNKSPMLYAKLSDDNGINTTGNGIGHDITGVLDEDHSNLLLLNDFYEATEDDSKSGNVKFQFINLTKGEHSLYFKAWDIFNNSSDAVINFNVNDADGTIIEKVICFPNPAHSQVSFQYTHNVPNEIHNVVLEVFDITGRLVLKKEFSNMETGFISKLIEWDLSNVSGDALKSGVYPYRIKVSTSLGTSFINDKLIIIK